LTEVGAGGLAKLGGLGVSFACGARDVEAGDAVVEPEACDVGKISGGDLGVEVEQDTNVSAAGFVDEVVEIVEGAVGGVEGLGVGGVWLERGEEKSIGAEGPNVIKMLDDTMKAAAFGGAEVDRVYLVDDRMLPPNVRVHAGAGPAWTGEGLGWNWREKEASEAEGEKSAENRHSHCAC